MGTRDRKKVLGIVGSPRRGGNTDIMVDYALRGAGEAGAAVEKVLLNDLTIAPCEACYACDATGSCVQQDDMAALFERMDACGVWVLGTPVYWWGPSAQMKVFMDRWFAKASNRDYRDILSGRRVVLVIPLGDADPRTARHVVGMFEDALAYVKSDVFEVVLAPGAYDMGDVNSMPEVLEKARAAGERASGAE
ncbi:MAG: flavodoxin family protein [bacterium]|jgi:putative NADPH-quinone reductase